MGTQLERSVSLFLKRQERPCLFTVRSRLPILSLAHQVLDAFEHRIGEQGDQDRIEGESPVQRTTTIAAARVPNVFSIFYVPVYFSCLHEGGNGIICPPLAHQKLWKTRNYPIT